jgi:hypothetical protein
MLGDQDPPFLDRQLEHGDLHTPVGVDRFDLPTATKHVCARVCGVGQHPVHGAVVGGLPPDPPLADRPAREPLTVAHQLGNDLTGGAEAIPQLIDAPNRAADLLIEREADLAVLVALKPDRQREMKLTAAGLVLKPAT